MQGLDLWQWLQCAARGRRVEQLLNHGQVTSIQCHETQETVARAGQHYWEEIQDSITMLTRFKVFVNLTRTHKILFIYKGVHRDITILPLTYNHNTYE